MKNKNKKIYVSLSVLMICFLISSSSFNTLSIKALLEKENNQFNIDSFDRSNWKWNLTEVVSTESVEYSGYPSHAVDSEGNIHVAWYDYGYTSMSGGDADIFYKRWNVTTSTWTTIEVVSTESSGESLGSSLYVDLEGNVYIVWFDRTNYTEAGTDYDIFYKRWNVTTFTWSTTEVISTESTEASRAPTLAVDVEGNVHIAWDDITDYGGSGGNGDIFYRRWNSTSLTWTTTEVVSTESTNGASSPSLSVDSLGIIHVAWFDNSNYDGAGIDSDIFYKRWNTTTLTWTTTEVISTESTSASAHPSLAVDSSRNIHVAWYDYTDYESNGADVDIFYKRWNTTTLTWTTTEVISTMSINESRNPSLTVDTEEDVHITWDDETAFAGSGTDRDIFYKRWDSNASNWKSTEVISTESTADSTNPSVAVDSLGYIHIVWTDFTVYVGADNDGDIFYKLFANSPATPELEPIIPNPTENNNIVLHWNNVIWATSYYVYRSTAYIGSVEGLTPITYVSESEFIDILPSEGIFFYVVVAENFAGNSTHSNCQYVEYELPHVREFTIISGLILGAMVVSLVILKTRRNKLK